MGFRFLDESVPESGVTISQTLWKGTVDLRCYSLGPEEWITDEEHPRPHLVALLAGQARLVFESGERVIQAGSSCLIEAGTRYGIKTEQGCRFWLAALKEEKR